MEINGISGNISPSTVTTPTAASTTSNPEATQPQHDSVHLSGTALARSLKQSGLNAAQIALKMHLDVKTVDGYLGIETKAATTTLPPTTTAAPQVKQTAMEPAVQKATETAQGKS